MALSDKDVDASMAADWAAIQDKYATEEQVPEPAEAANAEPEAEAVETIPVTREPDGKFKAKDKEAKAAPEKTLKAAPEKVTAAKAAPEGAPEVSQEPDQPQARDINRAPSTWKPTARAEWDKLPPGIRAEIHRREADFQNGQAQLLPDATLGKTMRQTAEPYRMMIEAEGGTPERAFASLLRTAAIFRVGSPQEKLQAIAGIAQQFQVDLRPLLQGQQPQAQPQSGQPQQFRDPRVDQLLAQQNRERQEVAAREQHQTESTVTRWMNEVDAQGNPKRPYLGDVINEMSALVPQLRQADPTLTHAQALDAAYDRAIWAHPEIRTLLAQKQQTELEAQRRTDNQARVRDARKASSVNVPRRASVPSPGKPGTIDETIANTARELGLIA